MNDINLINKGEKKSKDIQNRLLSLDPESALMKKFTSLNQLS